MLLIVQVTLLSISINEINTKILKVNEEKIIYLLLKHQIDKEIEQNVLAVASSKILSRISQFSYLLCST